MARCEPTRDVRVALSRPAPPVEAALASTRHPTAFVVRRDRDGTG